MAQKCRLCLQIGTVMTSVLDYHEGLPISVIMMIVCPVTITMDDKLPKFICEECLEIVISAYKLRAISCKNELYLLSLSEDDNQQIAKNNDPIAIVKIENFSFAEERILNNSSLSSLPETDDRIKNYTVRCNTSGKSLIWKYAGPLCNESGEVVFHDYVYCSLCMAEGTIKRYFKDANTSSTVLKHLKKTHELGRKLKPKLKPPQTKAVEEKSKNIHNICASTTDSGICSFCGMQFANKYIMLRHIRRKHLKKVKQPNDSEFDMRNIAIGEKSKRVQKTSLILTTTATCDFCNLECANKYIMLRHIQRKHFKAEKKTDGSEFDMRNIVVGEKSKRVQKASVYAITTAICEFCNLQCANKYVMLRHIRRKHIKKEKSE